MDVDGWITGSRTALHVALLAGWLALGCSDDDGEEDWADCGGKCDGESAAVAPLSAPDLLVNNLEVLGQLEGSGFDLGSRLGGASTSNATLASSSALFASLADAITADITAVKSRDPAAAVGIGASHRLFDVRWLRSTAARFRLVGITNRIDRMSATPGACGEVRFIYRLGYSSTKGASGLPMTLLVAHEQARIGGGCSAVAQGWQGQTLTADKLRAGPLAAIGPAVRIEVNLQSVRWPAAIRDDMGGHAEYLMRVFAIAGQSLSAAKLPNTIATDLSAAQTASLRQWILDHVAEIEDGTAQVPDPYLATVAFSVSPRGLARGANRPYLRTFPDPEAAFASADFSRTTLVKSPGGLVRRLDTMTCQGCHQSRGLAGFHMLGEDDPQTTRANAIEVGTSPHLHEELRWRKQALAHVAGDGTLGSPRPFAERYYAVPGIYGSHCGLGDKSFESWTCGTGFTCKDINGEEVGMCVPSTGPSAGDACETSSVTFTADPHTDTVFDMAVQGCKVPSGGAASCSRSAASGSVGGFPNGSCSARCTTMGAVGKAAICGATPPSGFNECLGQGRQFTECLANASPAFRRRCDSATPCGDDYVCAGVAGAPRGVGACMPPYFIFQARVDGHQVP